MKICSNCNRDFEESYCNYCGQKAFLREDKSLKHILNEFFYGITSFDKGFLKSLFTLLRRPGQMSKDYSSGKQKVYFRPVSFFLVVVVVYMLSPFLKGMQPEFDNFRQTLFFRDSISKSIEKKIEANHKNYEELKNQFNSKAEFTGKLSMLLLIPFAALIIWGLFYSRKTHFYDTLILSIEINSYYLLVFFVLLPLVLSSIVFIAVNSLEKIGISFDQTNVQNNSGDDGLATVIFFMALVLWYLFTIFRRFFEQHWAYVLIKSILFLVVFIAFTLSVYRFIVFKLIFIQI